MSEDVLPCNVGLGMERREVAIDLVHEKEVVEVVNGYLSIPVTSFDARKIEQVEIFSLRPENISF